MDTVCPKCGVDIPREEINVATGVAYCRECDTLHKLSELADRERIRIPATDDPPAGAWIRDDGRAIRVGATTRSVGTAGFFILFSGFWNSIVAVFVVGAVASLLGINNSFAGSSSQGGSVFVLLFMIPFVLVGLVTAFIALMALFGRCEISLRGMEGQAFTGLGPIGWKRRFDASRVRDVTIETANSSTNGKPDRHVVIDAGDRTIKIGSVLSRARRRWLAGALTRVLLPSR